jgi:hypothetical protein
MPNQYTIHRVVLATLPGLKEARDQFLGALLAPASFRDGFDARLQQAVVKNNIKDSVFFLAIFGMGGMGSAWT